MLQHILLEKVMIVMGDSNVNISQNMNEKVQKIPTTVIIKVMAAAK